MHRLYKWSIGSIIAGFCLYLVLIGLILKTPEQNELAQSPTPTPTESPTPSPTVEPTTTATPFVPTTRTIIITPRPIATPQVIVVTAPPQATEAPKKKEETPSPTTNPTTTPSPTPCLKLPLLPCI